MLPLIFVYVLISINFKNSIILSLSIFIFLIAMDYLFKFYCDITPISIMREFLSISNSQYNFPSDKFNISLFFMYIFILFPISMKSFCQKEMLN